METSTSHAKAKRLLDERTSGDTEGAGICGDSLGAISHIKLSQGAFRGNPPVSLVSFPEAKEPDGWKPTTKFGPRQPIRPLRPRAAGKRRCMPATEAHRSPSFAIRARSRE